MQGATAGPPQGANSSHQGLLDTTGQPTTRSLFFEHIEIHERVLKDFVKLTDNLHLPLGGDEVEG